MFLSQVNRFRFCPKILVRSKAIWFGLEIVLGKIERFYIIQKLTDQNKTFDLVHLLSERKQNVLIWSAYCRNKMCMSRSYTLPLPPSHSMRAVTVNIKNNSNWVRTVQMLQHDERLYLLRRVFLTMYSFISNTIQGGSDISGTLSMLHRRIKK